MDRAGMGDDRNVMTMKWPEAWREAVAWTVGGVCIFVLCLLVTFPYDLLQTRLVTELKRATGMDVRVADWNMGPPLSLEWRNVSLSKPNMVPIDVASLQANLGLLQAFTGSVGLDVVVQLDEQTTRTSLAKGTVSSSSFSLAGPLAVKGQLQQIDLSKLIRPYVTHGTLNGQFAHRVDSNQSPTGTMNSEGTWTAEATDLVIDQVPLGGGRTLSLTFSKASAGLSCRNLVCEVTQLKGDGIDGSFDGQGQITIQQPTPNSQLALTVTVIPGPGFASKAGTLGLPSLPPGTPLTIKIVGTLAQARIAL